MEINLDLENHYLELLETIAKKHDQSIDKFVSNIVKEQLKNQICTKEKSLLDKFDESLEETSDEETKEIIKHIKSLTKDDLEITKEEIEDINLD